MDFQLLNEIFTADFNIDSIISVQQSRDDGVRFNYLETPRRSHGLFLLTDYPVVYELPNGDCLQANPGDVMLLPKGAHYAINFAPPPEKLSVPWEWMISTVGASPVRSQARGLLTKAGRSAE